MQSSLQSILSELFPASSPFFPNPKFSNTKKIILACRESFFKLLKLKNSEFRTKRVVSCTRSIEKQSKKHSTPKCRLPVEGHSIKLQSPSSVKLPRNDSQLSQKSTQDYHPELYETLVEQYKMMWKVNNSGQASPEELSPRIYKPAGLSKPQTPHRGFPSDSRNPVETFIVKNSRTPVLVRSRTKSPSSYKLVRRIRRMKQRLG
jgi:hypothetical protein